MDSRIAKMTHPVAAYSTAIQAGGRALIRASSPVAEPLVQALYQESLRAGAYAFTYIHLRGGGKSWRMARFLTGTASF